MTKKKQKLFLKDIIGWLNASASLFAITSVFIRIFAAQGLESIAFLGPLVIAFVLCLYFARARFLGYKFSTWTNSWMVGVSIAVIASSIWSVFSIL